MRLTQTTSWALVLVASHHANAAGSCGAWETVPSPDPAASQDTRLHGIHAITAADIWAVGHYSVPITQFVDEHLTLTLHWDGTQWTQLASPSPGLDFPGGTDCYLEAVDAIAADDVWAVGHWKTVNPLGQHVGQQALTLHWDGSGWEQVAAPFTKPESSGGFLFDVEVIATDDVWAGGLWPYPYKGAGGAAALMLHYDGSSWEFFDTPFISSNGHEIRAVSALASDDVWAVGGYGIADATPYVIRWDGNSWSQVDGIPAPGIQNWLRDVVALAPDDIWIAGEQLTVSSGYQPLMLHYDGTSWTEVASPGGGTAIAAISPDNIYSTDTWTTGQSIAHWDGTAWSLMGSVGSGGNTLLDLSVVSECDVWGAGRMPNGANFLGLIQHLEPDLRLPEDVDGDGSVGVTDLMAVILGWGQCPVLPAACPADVDGNDAVDVADLLAVVLAWG